MVSGNASQKNKIEQADTLDYKDWSMDIDAERRGSRYPISTLEDGLTESTRDGELRNFYGELVDEDDYDRDLIKELFSTRKIRYNSERRDRNFSKFKQAYDNDREDRSGSFEKSIVEDNELLTPKSEVTSGNSDGEMLQYLGNSTNESSDRTLTSENSFAPDVEDILKTKNQTALLKRQTQLLNYDNFKGLAS